MTVKGMIVVGLVGKIGAGKSTVARRLAAHGARVIDADALAHEVLEEARVKRKIVADFGDDVLGLDGRVQRSVLGERVFGPSAEHAAALQVLEAIVHPRVHERIQGMLDQARADEVAGGNPRVVVLDVPLLYRAGWDAVCDCLILIGCDEAVRRERLANRRLSPAQQAAREASWQGSQRHPSPDLITTLSTHSSGNMKLTNPTASSHFPEGKAVAMDTSGDLAYTLAAVDRIWFSLLPSCGIT